MKVYKFRPASEIDRALDIILNRRLYCADWSNLNDPMEGRFECMQDPLADEDRKKKEVEQIVREKKRLRVCSLSATLDNHLLWAHYAAGFRGLAIELELPDDAPEICEVTYNDAFEPLNLIFPFNPEGGAQEILKSKYSAWSYEREVRVFYPEEYYRVQKPIGMVIAGHRMQPALFKALGMVCRQLRIPFAKTRIGNSGVEVEPLPLQEQITLSLDE